MRWREVSRIPYGDLKGRMPKDAAFRAVPQVRTIEETDYLVIDFYRRKEKEPVIRAAYSKDDYGIMWPKDGVKTAQRLTDELGKIKTTEGPVLGKRIGPVYMALSDQDVVSRYWDGKPMKDHQWLTWTGCVNRIENDIAAARCKRRVQLAEEKMIKRHEDTPEIPESYIKYAAGLLDGVGFLFYKKSHGKATVQCSRCGVTCTVRFRRPDGIDGMVARIGEEPVNDKRGTCECCGGSGIYKPIGRMKNEYHIQQASYLIQPFRKSGIVLRESVTEKIIILDEPEQVVVGERSRTYFFNGKEQTDWFTYAWSNEGWQYWNGGGMNPWKLQSGPVWPGSWPLIKETAFGHSGCREWLRWADICCEKENPGTYFRAFAKMPYLEMAVKAGWWKLATRLVRNNYDSSSLVPRPKAGRPADMLNIWPERLKMVTEAEGSIRLLAVLRAERESGRRLRKEWIDILMQMNGPGEIVHHILRYMNIERFLNRTQAYSGVELKAVTECGSAAAAFEQTVRMYLDYLDMQEAAGADMTDQIIQHPRDLRAEHDKLVIAANDEKNRLHCLKKEAEFPGIKKNYRRLRLLYSYEAEGFAIRPARSATEIIEEGQYLHHCVGGDSYLGKHDRGQSIILFLRPVSMANVPFVTVEIEPGTHVIRQWYGIRDTKPQRQMIDAWLLAYTKMLADYGSAELCRQALQADAVAPAQMEIITAAESAGLPAESRLMVAAG